MSKTFNDYQKATIGGFGQRVLGVETSVAGENFVAFTVLADASVSWTNVTPKGGDASQTTVTLLAGTTIYGEMTTIIVASGSLIAYLSSSTFE